MYFLNIENNKHFVTLKIFYFQENKVDNVANITIPKYNDGGRVKKGSCAVGKDGTQSITVVWPISVWENNISFIFNKTDKKNWKLSSVVVNIVMEQSNFPNSTYISKNYYRSFYFCL